MRLSGRGLRIPLGGDSFSVELGAERIQLDPLLPLDDRSEPASRDLLVQNAAQLESGIAHFLVLEPGRRLRFNRGTREHHLLFDQPRNAFRRNLQITHQGDALVFRDSISEVGTYVRLLASPEGALRRRERLLRNLDKVVEAFGGPIQALSAEAALETIRQVNRLLLGDPYRSLDSSGNPGALLELPGDVTPILVGDLHGQVDNLLTILCSNGFLEALEAGRAALIILGDAVHSEQDDQLESMDSSVLMMDLIQRLKLRFPERFFFIIGNHDSFLSEVMKGGIPQSLIWGDALTRLRGREYKQAMERFYQLSPLVALSLDFVACHAAPPRVRITRDQLVNLRQHPELAHQMTFSRVQTRARPGGYSRGDVRRFRRCLAHDESFPFVVGHYPLSPEGTVWLDVERIPQHHIVYSARREQVGVFTRVGGVLVPQVYRVEPLLDWIRRGGPP